ncbi:hypothetical protein NDU88_004421 [Pleurodeles waltl]|uniref:Uncharacterized protein n=1 Tax=Pleurodeles waltl TaxID=8319 RepID=A0AAV7LLB7_PLEWA|nr:hypothetical protein NDU88_004421 [Pleurodeles waltl]
MFPPNREELREPLRAQEVYDQGLQEELYIRALSALRDPNHSNVVSPGPPLLILQMCHYFLVFRVKELDLIL